MKSQLNRLVLAWLILGVLGAVFGATVAFSMTLFLKTVVDAWIIGGFAFLGFLPGLLGACGQRFAGLAGFVGLVAGFFWGIGESVTRKGIIWPVFVYICVLQAFLLALGLGLVVQVFIKPKPLPANKPIIIKPKHSASVLKMDPMKPTKTRKPKNVHKAHESRLYEV